MDTDDKKVVDFSGNVSSFENTTSPFLSTSNSSETFSDENSSMREKDRGTLKHMLRQGHYNHRSLRDILLEQGYELTEKKKTRGEKICNPNKLQKFYTIFFFLPMFVSLWYASAILFPPGFRNYAPFLLWTDGALTKNQEGYPLLCPRASICAEGVFQIVLIAMARLTAFASYSVMGLTFFSKMHSLIHFLSTTYISTIIPLESLHEVHKFSGKMFGSLALFHTIMHYLRYIVRKDVDHQISTQVHISGLVAILAMAFVVLSMVKISRTRFAFEKRFNTHWMFLLVVVALLFHNPRTRKIVLTFFGLWAFDYGYGLLYRTHRLGVVEFTHIGDCAGTQMLWRNPEGFNVKSGEYVFIKLPWLKEGKDEWHPFSIYLREATEEGLNEIHYRSNSSRNVETQNDSLSDFVQTVLTDEFVPVHNPMENSIKLSNEVRQEVTSFKTTQVFINPVGNWTKGLLEQVKDRKQLQSCWVKGPFTSPYFIANDYSHFVMTASGIGITPALGVMGQFSGFSRTKIFVWTVRDKAMLQFFAPLLKDAHLSVIFYTGKEKFTTSELRKVRSYGNIFVKQSRPENLADTIGDIITQFENSIDNTDIDVVNLRAVSASNKKSWCVLYCGGSKFIRDQMQKFAKDNGLGWESELFNW